MKNPRRPLRVHFARPSPSGICAARLRRGAWTLTFAFLAVHPALAQTPQTKLRETVASIEDTLDARVGLVIRQSGTDWSWSHRGDERVLMTSTFKALLCGAVLARADAGTLDLDEALAITPSDLQDYAQVTEARVGTFMSIGDLCLATIDLSDNTAANLLIDRLGEPGAVTDFLRSIGDEVGRLDRHEPALNTRSADGLSDTSTPDAMATSLEALLVGDALSPSSRAQLREWMGLGGVTGSLLRAYVRDTWDVADKSGASANSRSLIAMVTPDAEAPYFVAIYISEAEVGFERRNAALIALSAAVADLMADQ
ncbi:class A beta-lactamase [Yoonia litorea]|uniref:beta-lactamase n=1 Tax=Yoonia litorea TaxID=1123755 RepID=A0A1I6MDV7_9RHOB|nr:class A beta-lactamase [Yoonia litorea]SFS13841.1 beta-lactamase class A [Yoonia litorea]